MTVFVESESIEELPVPAASLENKALQVSVPLEQRGISESLLKTCFSSLLSVLCCFCRSPVCLSVLPGEFN